MTFGCTESRGRSGLRGDAVGDGPRGGALQLIDSPELSLELGLVSSVECECLTELVECVGLVEWVGLVVLLE